MPYVIEFSKWIKASHLSWMVLHYPWIWPTCETLHFIGLAALFGTVGMLDLRVLGMGKGLPFAPLHKLVPWGVGGFVINVLTGICFFAGDPFQYIHNIAFQLKMLFVLLAGINMGIFYVTGMFRHAEGLGPGQDAPFGAKIVAGTSLFLWIGVMYFGRMLPFLGDAF